MIDARREQRLHHAHVILVHILLIWKRDFRRLVVSAFADAYARRNLQQVLHIIKGSSQVRLHHDADIIQIKLRAQTLEDVYRDLRHV